MKVAIYSRIIEESEQGVKSSSCWMNSSDVKSSRLFIFLFLNASARCSVSRPIFYFFVILTTWMHPIDFLISLGGDGTLLDTIAFVRDKEIPVIGINFGRLGFLASIGKGDMITAVQGAGEQNLCGG